MAKRQQPRARNSSSRRSKVPVTYYRSSSSDIAASDSPFERVAKKRKSGFSKWLAQMGDLLVIVAVLLVLAYSLIVKASPDFSVNSSVYRASETYKNAIIKDLQKVKNHNKVSFDEKGLVVSLQKQFPEISNVAVELPIFSQTPKVNITISNPALLFKNASQSYIVDGEGVAVGSPSEFKNVNNLPTIIDQTGFETSSGKQIISANSVRFINDLIKQCKKAHVLVSSLSLPAKAQELDLRTSDKSYYVKFYIGGDVMQQTGQYLATRHQLDVSHIIPAQYMDVRVAGKVFYK
jgi:cell division septal protein FtsQ